MANHILIVDDEEDICQILSYSLQAAGYQPSVAHSAEDALALIEQSAPDLLLLDIMMEGLSGTDLAKRLQERGLLTFPIIFLTALTSESDVLKGFQLGADDYITKPFEVKELLARIHAVMRRTEDNDAPKEKKLCYDKLIVNLDSYELIVNGKKVDTPPKEMELLYHLAASPNIVFTRNQLLDEVWGFDYFGDSRTVDVHIKRLREKLEGVSDQWSLQTVWGVGYKFEVAR